MVFAEAVHNILTKILDLTVEIESRWMSDYNRRETRAVQFNFNGASVFLNGYAP